MELLLHGSCPHSWLATSTTYFAKPGSALLHMPTGSTYPTGICDVWVLLLTKEPSARCVGGRVGEQRHRTHQKERGSDKHADRAEGSLRARAPLWCCCGRLQYVALGFDIKLSTSNLHLERVGRSKGGAAHLGIDALARECSRRSAAGD
jgi:hypothetical protein